MAWGKRMEMDQIKRGVRSVSVRGNPIYKVLEVPGNVVHLGKCKELLLGVSQCLD